MSDLGSLPGEWLVVLPDHPESDSVAALLGPVPQRIDHPSGRPWLLGRWAHGDLRVGTAGARRSVAVLGFCSATTQRLGEIAARTSDPVALDGLDEAGSFHLVAAVDGVSRFQGSLSGLRRVFRATTGGITVAATRADVLADIVGARVDRGRLALGLLLCDAPLTTINASHWTGVHAVDEDCCLLQFSDGRAVSRRRWTPPPDDRPLPEAARALRTALVDSVAARLDAGLPMTADLSGGLDSTTLCFLAGRDGRPITTITDVGDDDADDDAVWADRAAAHLPNISRVLIPSSEMPSLYSDILQPGPRADEPFPCVESRAVHWMLVSRLRQEGSHMHLCGDGGDEVLAGGASAAFDLLRRNPWTALRHLRAHRAFRHRHWREIAATAWERRDDYPTWLAKRARTIRISSMEDNRWTDIMAMPPWATEDAAEIVRDTLLTEAAQGRQHGPDWTTHQTISGIRQGATLTRALATFYAENGIRVTSPFLDDNVIDACMAAPAHLRSTPWVYKALLRSAMQGIVPERSLERTTKAEGSSVEYAGLRANADRLAALCDESRLGRMGLIDPAVLRATCTGLNFRLLTPVAISLSMSCERWLRDLEVPAGGETPTGADRVPSVTNGRPR